MFGRRKQNLYQFSTSTDITLPQHNVWPHSTAILIRRTVARKKKPETHQFSTFFPINYWSVLHLISLLSFGCSSFGQSRVVMAGTGQRRARAAPCNTLQQGEQGLTLTLIDRQGSRRPSTSLPFLHFVHNPGLLSLFGAGLFHPRLPPQYLTCSFRIDCLSTAVKPTQRKAEITKFIHVCQSSVILLRLLGVVWRYIANYTGLKR